MAVPEEMLGSYRLVQRIGAGGMGEVWKAEDTRLGRMVALKIVAPEVAHDPEAIVRLRREARLAAQLNHPNIATIHSIEEAGGQLFVVMEFVDGQPLSALIKRGRIPEAELCRVGRNVADALAEAHGKGIIHRDIKPDNVIVSGAKVKVLDFGIAKQIGISGSTSDAPTATFMTQQGMIVGTIHYMSPEQALGKPLDPRTDIFSLGVVLYEAATGRLPFRGETVTDTMTQIIRDDAQEPVRVNPSVSQGLNAVIRRCMEKNPDARYPSAAALARALEAPTVRTGPAAAAAAVAPKQKTPWMWIAGLLALLLIGTGLVAIRHHQRLTAASTRSVSAHQHLQQGERALIDRNFPKAIEQYRMALDEKQSLDDRERALVRLGIAIGMHRRLEAEKLSREIERRWPDDPDLAQIRAQFAEGARRLP